MFKSFLCGIALISSFSLLSSGCHPKDWLEPQSPKQTGKGSPVPGAGASHEWPGAGYTAAQAKRKSVSEDAGETAKKKAAADKENTVSGGKTQSTSSTSSAK